jgi:two-component system, chemotaxis family, sensor kinase CheA
MDNQLIEFKARFVEDATKLIDALERDLMLLETSPKDSFLIEEVFRCMHTLKGTSGMYGFYNIENLTHQLESIYDLIRDGVLDISSELIQTTLLSSDLFRSLLNNDDKIADDQKVNYGKVKSLISGFDLDFDDSVPARTIEKPQFLAKTGYATWQITFTPEETIISQNINLVNTFKDLFALGKYHIAHKQSAEGKSIFIIFLYTDQSLSEIEDALIFILDYCKIMKIADFDIFNHDVGAYNSEPTQNGDKKESKSSPSDSIVSDQKITESSRKGSFHQTRIAVDSSKLDELMYLVSELITTNSQLVLAAKNQAYKPLLPLFEKIDKLSKQFRNNTLSLRLVPINDMIVRFQRLVRDLSATLGKEVELTTQGTETELDKSTIDALVDPLMHIIRNCIDHGIESPDIRKINGKPPKGVVKVGAYHSGNFVFIQVQDDGKGIDTQYIRQKAIEKGFINESTVLSEKELYDLIFIPGFSTAESLTQVSGRGVGMDVVMKKITELRGQVEVTSELGLGTSFTIKLHQTIAILDTMLFQVDDMFFMVPLSDVEECRLIDSQELDKRKYSQTISFNDRLIPYVDLYELFKLSPNGQSGKIKLLVINRQENYFAVAADAIIGEHQAVLKSVGEAAKKQPLIALASVLGDGNLAYLLDMNAVHNLVITNKIK